MLVVVWGTLYGTQTVVLFSSSLVFFFSSSSSASTVLLVLEEAQEEEAAKKVDLEARTCAAHTQIGLAISTNNFLVKGALVFAQKSTSYYNFVKTSQGCRIG
jgi:hypothetical protein